MNYENTWIEPLALSTISSRFDGEIDTSVNLEGLKIKLPIISSPMDSIDNPDFFVKIVNLGGIGVIHRFMSPQEQAEIFMQSPPQTIVAVGIKEEDFRRVDILAEQGARNFLIDIANGFNKNIELMVAYLRSGKFWVMAGNVASSYGYVYLAELGVNAVRVGISTGSACTTKRMTGIHVPIIDAIRSCYLTPCDNQPAIIADGGVKEPGHLCKALVAGADAVMMGYTFSRCVESTKNLKLGGTRTYRGMSSFSAQKDAGKEAKAVEGEEFSVKVDCTLKEVMDSYQNGLRSSMSYLNARSIKEVRKNGKIITD